MKLAMALLAGVQQQLPYSVDYFLVGGGGGGGYYFYTYSKI
jgi:hypothetical protein